MEDDAHTTRHRSKPDAARASEKIGTGSAPSLAAIRGGRGPAAATVAHLPAFDEVIDVRSESEFAEDHIPGAINCPVLNDAERAQVGTVYAQHSPFEAKKIGAALVSANIARHLGADFHDRPRDWKPLVYCWRGGGRSGSLAHVLSEIGWRTGRLHGGYKAYRRAVIADLQVLPAKRQWRVLCGLTGTGKSRLLRELEARGGQVLDLEALAQHRGSVLGDVPGRPQPTQKMFESLVWSKLRAFDASRPVFVESESRKIGRLRVPESLIDQMWRSPCVVLEAPLAVRAALLRDEYAHFEAEPAALVEQLACLAPLHGHATTERWSALAAAGDWDRLVEELLVQHYDPAYTRSTLKHYPALADAPHYKLDTAEDSSFAGLAETLLEN